MNVLPTLRRLAGLFILSATLSCSPAAISPQPVLQSNLIIYSTATISVFPSPTAVVTEIPIPTSTPSIYTVVLDDTLTTIAARFGLPLDDLQAANPGVIAESLAIGQTLKIPSGSLGAASASASNPAPADVGLVNCYPSGAGIYCLVPVHNPYPEPLENVKLQITLLDFAGQPIASQEASLPLNILPSGSSLPACAFFSAPPADSQPIAQIITSIRLLRGDRRYLPVTVRNTIVSVAWAGRSARVQGQVLLPLEGKPATSIWLTAVAYSADAKIVGFRRWEWQGSLQPGQTQPFDFAVYSSGPAIRNVDVISEARP